MIDLHRAEMVGNELKTGNLLKKSTKKRKFVSEAHSPIATPSDGENSQQVAPEIDPAYVIIPITLIYYITINKNNSNLALSIIARRIYYRGKCGRGQS